MSKLTEVRQRWAELMPDRPAPTLAPAIERKRRRAALGTQETPTELPGWPLNPSKPEGREALPMFNGPRPRWRPGATGRLVPIGPSELRKTPRGGAQ
jgi:hypothetical protein